jgi:hypothetical protein
MKIISMENKRGLSPDIKMKLVYKQAVDNREKTK